MGKRSKKGARLERTRNVVCSGGPRDRAWYTQDWWDQAVAAAHHDGETTHTGRTLGYVLTDGVETNAQHTHVSGRVLRWNPDRAAELVEQAATS